MLIKNDNALSSGPLHRGLVVLADGALLSERNAHLKESGEPTLDFRTIPDLVAQALGADVEPSKETSYYFQIGARSAEQFIANISTAWTVQAFPLRAFAAPCQCGKPSVRFTSAIAWAVGNIAGRRVNDHVVCVSNDPALVMPIRFARDQGVDARMAWLAPAGEEVRYFASRNDVPLLLLEAAEGQMLKAPQTFGQTFLRGASSAQIKEPGRSRPRKD